MASNLIEKLRVVENHHEVLVYWAECRRKLKRAPRLITIDHHTDTSSPFRTLLKDSSHEEFQQEQTKRLAALKFTDPQSVTNAIQLLAHDEHIITALKCDILSSAWVVAHNAQDTDIATYQKHKVICYSVSREKQNATRHECDQILESHFLQSAVRYFHETIVNFGEASLFESPYILDIDLDAFNTQKSLKPQDDSFFRKLIAHAEIITVAVEPRHFSLCSLDSEYLFQEALTDLNNFFKQ